MNLQQAHSNMIEQQVRPWDVLDQRVLDVLAKVPREAFLTAEHQRLAYSDYALPIGHGQHMFKPGMDARLLQALLLETTDKVLEIGTGSGYLSACLAGLCAQVDSLEIIGELAETARQHLKESGTNNVTIHHQDASQNRAKSDRYDAIAFAGAIPSIPQFYMNKLHIGGRLFAVIGECTQATMEAVLITRIRDKEWHRDSLFETRVEPLINFDSESPSFIF